MIEWLQTIFASPSDQARLISILLSATVAVLVLLLNQWFINRRERKKVITSKIEEMYVTSIDYTKAAHRLLNDLQSKEHRTEKGYYVVDQKTYGQMNDAIRKMEMLCGLYFEEAGFDPNDYSIHNMPIIEVSVKGKPVEEMEGYTLYEESKEHVKNAEKKLALICRKLMQKKKI